MKTRFVNALILTMEDDEIFEGELSVDGTFIDYVGESREGVFEFDRVIDCGGNLIMPGFKNAHTHSPMTFLRSYADDMPLDEWLHTRIFPNEALLTDENIYWNNKLAILEYLSGGITSNFDMYIAPDVVYESSKESGFRTIQTGSLNDFTLSLDKMEECYKKYNGDDLSGYRLGIHAEYTTSRELIEGVADMAKRFKAPVYLHMHETEKEVRECVQRYKYTPTVFLERQGFFDYGGGGFHCVHMTDEDVDVFKTKKLNVVTCPASNSKLASGIAPIRRYIDENINTGIGTDGPASNNALDMFREMYLVAVLAKLREKDAAVVKAFDVLKMATCGSAHAMGLDNGDTLAAGKYADVIMLDLHAPNMQPPHDIISQIVYSAGKSNVLLTMVNGKVLYENGKYFIDKDVEEIYERCQKNKYIHKA